MVLIMCKPRCWKVIMSLGEDISEMLESEVTPFSFATYSIKHRIGFFLLLVHKTLSLTMCLQCHPSQSTMCTMINILHYVGLCWAFSRITCFRIPSIHSLYQLICGLPSAAFWVKVSLCMAYAASGFWDPFVLNHKVEWCFLTVLLRLFM